MRSWMDSTEIPCHPADRVPATARLCAALALILGVVAVPPARPALLLWVAGCVALAVLLARVSLPPLLKRLLMLGPFVLGVSLLALFQPDGAARALLLLAKGSLSLTIIIVLSTTTRFSELMRALRSLRVPTLLVTTVSLMGRYLLVLGEESERMRRARRSRTFVRGHWLEWRTAGTTAAQLFVRSSERAERIHNAMCARGWNATRR